MTAKVSKGLKEYILTDFGDKTHKQESLMDIYESDYSFFLHLRKLHKIRQDADKFFSICGIQLREARSISIDAFRDWKYEMILQDYVNGKIPRTVLQCKQGKQKQGKQGKKREQEQKRSTSQKRINKAKPIKKKRISRNAKINIKLRGIQPSSQARERRQLVKMVKNFSDIVCSYDLEILHCEKCLKLKDLVNNTKYLWNETIGSKIAALYRCNVCGRAYALVDNHLDDVTGGRLSASINKMPADRNNGFVADFSNLSIKSRKECMIYGEKVPNKCSSVGCGNTLKKIKIKIKGRDNTSEVQECMWCSHCGMIYIPFHLYKQNEMIFKCRNLNESFYLIHEEEQKDNRNTDNRNTIRDNRKKGKKVKHTTPASIHVKDFVVRQNVFRCMHRTHKLKNIDAAVSVIKQNGDVETLSIPAGYCSQCNIFFIMESTYEQLASLGTPACRISDVKTYLAGKNYVKGMTLAKKSILMQYGYSVSQQENLSSRRRQKILAILVDNDVMSKSEIISYLDFFINQRQYQPRFDIAISKWEEDRNFISIYHTGYYDSYVVKSIHRRT